MDTLNQFTCLLPEYDYLGSCLPEALLKYFWLCFVEIQDHLSGQSIRPGKHEAILVSLISIKSAVVPLATALSSRSG